MTDFMDCVSTNRFHPADNESDIMNKAVVDDLNDEFLAGNSIWL